ncbi:MAG: four helix bundle protein [Flavobacteriales bacterium]|nr:four helix bundle protein [Flavobacteriales bacterium]MCB9449713.1 four helix bundle protein [Flavobacteriales bacterium]
MGNDQQNPLLEVTFEFALAIMQFSEELEGLKKYVIAKQLLRSGTAIGALAREAQMAESRADFIHKLKIAQKEAEETEYWLLLCKHSTNYPNTDERLTNNLVSIKKLLSRIISTAIQNENSSKKMTSRMSSTH